MIMHIISIVGARPNFVKVAPICWETAKHKDIRHTLVHTGQHYDISMSDNFFQTLDIPQPDINLEVGSSSHGEQTGKVMIALEPVLEEYKPDWVLTYGDVNSTAAAALVAVKLGIKTAHVEAGLRSGDRSMPEEINRIVTDSISDLLFVTEQSGIDNLNNEGVSEIKTRFTGNVMIDSLIKLLPKTEKNRAFKTFGLEQGKYILVTLHRPSNVDNPDVFRDLLSALGDISEDIPVFFPIHPRTRKSIEEYGFEDILHKHKHLYSSTPVDYLTFLSLTRYSGGLITDSGGIQEETTYLGIPCITLRPNTERPSTITLGTNELVEPSSGALLSAFSRLKSGEWRKGSIPPLWDGKAAERIINTLFESE